MSGRELIILGTASQAPTRTRNHNGYLLRWDQREVLFDPGEGTQRQMTWAGVSASKLSAICLTHLHGDHCLGLPGVLQRVALDRGAAAGDGAPGDALPIHFPASGRAHVERLVDASIGRRPPVRLDPVPVTGEGARLVDDTPPLRLTARPLAHRVDTLGWRVDEAPRRHFLPERLTALGIEGPDVGRLARDGRIDIGDRPVTVDEVSETRPGHSMAVVMDTGVCDAAVALAEGVDVLLCEATFLESEADLAVRFRHLTARQAETIAREAGVRLLVLTHFSARYRGLDGHRREAGAVFPDVIAAEDLMVIEFPR